MRAPRASPGGRLDTQDGTLIPVRVLTVSGERVRLEQVAANLIDNSVKSTPAGGQVFVEVDVDAARGIVRARDTGIGIAAAALPHIWERLFRGGTSRTERGLGLGLSFVRAVVEAHGGSVTVASEPGRGSIFTVALPA